MRQNGLVHLYVGDGKGKTTAAAGLALRAAGRGKKALFAQFLKGKPSGEIAGLERAGVETLKAQDSVKFVMQMSESELDEIRREHSGALARILNMVNEGGYSLIVLDEIVDAVRLGCLPLSEVLDFIDGRPPELELVLTGRQPPGELLERCDYHTEFVCKKHPYQKGVPAREGIEY